MAHVFEKVYCAFCKLERGVCTKKHITWTNVLLSAVCAVLIMFIVWGSLEPKAVIVLAVCLMVSEVFVHLRWRMTMPCPHCHFDPVLYKRNRAQAALTVKNRLDDLQKSGSHLLRTNNPFQHLPKVTREELDKSSAESASKERLLSRHI